MQSVLAGDCQNHLSACASSMIGFSFSPYLTLSASEGVAKPLHAMLLCVLVTAGHQ